MKSINPNQIEIQLMYPKTELVNETLMNYELITKMNELRKLMRVYKSENIDMYKRIQREYMYLVK